MTACTIKLLNRVIFAGLLAIAAITGFVIYGGLK